MSIQITTVKVPKTVLEEIKIYCRQAGKPVGEFVENAWIFIKQNDFDIYDKESTPYLPVPEQTESRDTNQKIDALCQLMGNFITSSQQAQQNLLPNADTIIRAAKAEGRAEELERQLHEKEQQLQELEAYKKRAKAELERIKKEQSFFGKIKVQDL